MVPGVLEPDLNFPLSRDVNLCLLWNVGFCSWAYLATVVSARNVLTSLAENASPNTRWVGSFFLSLSCRSFCVSNLRTTSMIDSFVIFVWYKFCCSHYEEKYFAHLSFSRNGVSCRRVLIDMSVSSSFVTGLISCCQKQYTESIAVMLSTKDMFGFLVNLLR